VVATKSHFTRSQAGKQQVDYNLEFESDYQNFPGHQD
jgi:hypothetical protein